MLRHFAEYVMRGRRQAIIIALLFTFIPLMGWVSDAIVALVTLRKGPKEGAIVLIWVILPSIVVALLGYPELWIYDIIGGSVAVYGLALVLRRTGSWAFVLQISMLLGVAAVAVVHMFDPDIFEQSVKEITSVYNDYKTYFHLDVEPEVVDQTALLFAKFAVGTQVALMLIVDWFNIFIARWEQSALYNPQGLSSELQNLRLGLIPIVLLVLVLIAALSGVAVAVDAMPIVVLPFIMAGLSLVHDLVTVRKLSKRWLLVFYSLLILFFIYMAGLLVIAVVADHWLNFRRKLQTQ